MQALDIWREFVESWELFHNSYLEGWLVALMLSLIGVVVVARDQIFIGAAVSEASTVGIAVALCIATWATEPARMSSLGTAPSWLQSDTFQATMAVLFSIAAALLTARGGRARRESAEAITGWVFLISASLSVLIVSHSPHGLEEIHRVHSSSIIGATGTEVWIFGGFCLVSIVAMAGMHRRLLLFAVDPPMAASVGMKVRWWAVGTALWLGLANGLAIRASGMLYTFGMLVLPALVAKNLCREVRPMLLVSPLVALLTATIAFVLANHYDFPPAQAAIALLGLLLALVWIIGIRRWRSMPTSHH